MKKHYLLVAMVMLAACDRANAVLDVAQRAARDVQRDTDAALQGRVSVIDGDTLELHGQRIRLFGVDAPESSQRCQDIAGRPWRCGTQAARELDEFIDARTVTCTARDHDRYRRTVATCTVGGQDIGEWMVREGWAVAYTDFSSRYVPAQARASAARRGIHAGTFQAPSEYRRAHRRHR